MCDEIRPAKNLVQRNLSCESYDNECNEYINSDVEKYCDLPSAIQNEIVDKLNGDIISVNNSSNIHVGARIGKVVVDTFTVVSSREAPSDTKKRKLILALLSALCLVTGIAVLVYLMFFTESEVDWIVTRKGWGAKDAKQPCTESMDSSVVEIVIFQTKTEFCYDFDTCSEIVRNIQAEDLTDTSATDIKFNFLIGGDGKAYQGLDWLCNGEHVYLPFSALHLGFIGDYSKAGHNNRLSDSQKEVVRKLFAYGKEKNKLYETFGITPACCYKRISDPGENILNVIAYWPEYIRSCLHTANCDYSSDANITSWLNDDANIASWLNNSISEL